MRTHTTLPLVAALLGLAACGSTTEDRPDSSHHFTDGMVLDAAPADAGADAEPHKARCEDGLDNDGDGLIDYPEDPGCTSPTDEDESNPPYCGLTPAGEMIPLRNLPATGHLVQDTGNGASHYAGSCGGDGASELIFALEVTGITEGLVISTVSDEIPPITQIDTVIYARRDTCDASEAEVGCAAAEPGEGGAELVIENPTPGTYYLFVDSRNPGEEGQFLLQVRGLIPLGAPCDPADLTLVCAPGIICASPHPGDPTVCMVPYCSDGLDNDGDGIIDFPEEPGCESPLDNSEEDTCPGVGCPQCADGVDNDGDGFTDWPADPGCIGAGDPMELDECVPGRELTELPANGQATGSFTLGDPSRTAGSCGVYPGPEVVYPLSLPFGAEEVDITLATLNWTTVSLYVRAADCADGTELGCRMNWNSSENLHLEGLAPGDYFIFADSEDLYQSDVFDLTVEARLPVGAPCQLGNALAQCALGGLCQDVGGGVYECVPTVCNNGLDDDGDGYVDWPHDPGCVDRGDNDEADSCDPVNNPASCPVCWNGLDDDGDGLIDFPNDPGCRSAADPSEVDECVPGREVLDLPTSGVASIPISDAPPSLMEGSCSPYGSTNEERVYLLDLPFGATQVSVTATSQNWSYVNLYARSGDCETGPEIGCAFDWNNTETLTLHQVVPGTHFLVVDTASVYGNDTLVVTFNVALPVGAPCSPGSPVAACGSGSTCQNVGGLFQCVGTSCNNGIDDDNDGLVDFPWDPGCTSIDDNDEADSCASNPALCPACFDGVDNDGDGLVDYPDDPGCRSRADTSEVDECVPGVPFTDISLTGQGSGTPTGMSQFEGTCGGDWEPEDLYLLRLPGAASRVDITAVSSPDPWGDPAIETVLYLRRDQCDQPTYQVGCQSSSWPSPVNTLTLHNQAAGDLFIFVDANYIDPTGSYTLDVQATLTAGATCLPASTAIRCPSGTACTNPGTGFVCQ